LANRSGGLYNFRRELLESLAEKGELYAAIPNDNRIPELQQLGCRILETPIDRRGINPATDLKLLMRYIRLIRDIRPTKVITYTIKPNIYGGISCRLLRIPYAVNITGLGTTFQKEGWLKKFVILLYKTALKGAEAVFFENRGNLQIMCELGIVQQSRCHLLNGAGVNLEQYPFTAYPSENDTVKFLFIGRAMAEKGVNELFAAMQRLIAEGYRCQLDMLGYYEEDYRQTIEGFVQQGWLHYHGFQTDVKRFIESAHCFVLPSWHEGMANTNLECASMGRPLITSNIHGCKEAVIENVSGLLCEAKDADSLYAAMVRFLHLSPSERAAMGAAGREHMQAEFDKRKVVASTLEGLGLCVNSLS
jgi:galacturonosyltransferase